MAVVPLAPHVYDGPRTSTRYTMFLAGQLGQPGPPVDHLFGFADGPHQWEHQESNLEPRDLQPVVTPPEPPETQPVRHADAPPSSTGRSETAIHLTSDLAQLVEQLPTLPAHIKAAVMVQVGTAAPNPPADPKSLDDLERLPWEKRDGQ